MKTDIQKSIPIDDIEIPDKPRVPCLGCGSIFVWWLHPIQLCDDCVDKEYRKVENDANR